MLIVGTFFNMCGLERNVRLAAYPGSSYDVKMFVNYFYCRQFYDEEEKIHVRVLGFMNTGI